MPKAINLSVSEVTITRYFSELIFFSGSFIEQLNVNGHGSLIDLKVID